MFPGLERQFLSLRGGALRRIGKRVPYCCEATRTVLAAATAAMLLAGVTIGGVTAASR